MCRLWLLLILRVLHHGRGYDDEKSSRIASSAWLGSPIARLPGKAGSLLANHKLSGV